MANLGQKTDKRYFVVPPEKVKLKKPQKVNIPTPKVNVAPKTDSIGTTSASNPRQNASQSLPRFGGFFAEGGVTSLIVSGLGKKAEQRRFVAPAEKKVETSDPTSKFFVKEQTIKLNPAAGERGQGPGSKASAGVTIGSRTQQKKNKTLHPVPPRMGRTSLPR